MGVMYGKVRDGVFWIMDAAALPVEGTETRVNAGNQAMEYMVQYQESSGQVGKSEMLRGWYHSYVPLLLETYGLMIDTLGTDAGYLV
jgi:COP9 signalosome complex subunit 5